MTNFANGKIYKLTSNQTDRIYIGSTTQYLSKRLGHHQDNFKRFYNNGKFHYCTSFEIIKFEDCKIELIEKFSCENRKQLHRREGEYIKHFQDICVNLHIAGRTDAEYRNDYKDKIKEYKKNYQLENKDFIREYNKNYQLENKDYFQEYNKNYNKENKKFISEQNKKYYLNNKDKIRKQQKKYQLENKDFIRKQQKKYQLENKDYIQEYNKNYNKENKKFISEQNKKYYLNNKDKIKEYQEKNKDKIKEYNKKYQKNLGKTTCEICNTEITKLNFKRHENTKFHIKNFIEY